MLSIDLAALQRGPRRWQEVVEEPGEAFPDVPGRFAGPLAVDLRAEAGREGGVHVTGRLEATLVLPCRRCLREVEEPLDLPVDIRFRPGAEEEDGDEAGAVFPLDAAATSVSLVEALREDLLLAVPNFPLCRPDCGGLCPTCGVHRDEEECDCTFEEADPRWDALRALRSS